MKNILFAVLGLSLILFACDENDPIVDAGAPVIDFILPVVSTGGEYFQDTNNMVTIKADITDNDELHTVSLIVTNTFAHGQGHSIVDTVSSVHQHGQNYELNAIYTIDTACHSDFYFKIVASDHNENVSKDSILIHVHGIKGVMPVCN